jgi:hypothetical protein
MAAVSKRYRVAQILLTVGVFEFFGPIARDLSSTHLLNPSWVGHARFHLAWALVFMALSGLCNLYLIWFRRPQVLSSLYISWAWQACNIFGFWGAAVLERAYGGSIVDPEFHLVVMGLNENVFAFVMLTTILFISIVYLKAVLEPSMREPAASPS